MADLLLLLETSGAHCSVAVAQVAKGTRLVLAEAEHQEPMKHTAMLLPLIKEAFAKTPFTLQDTCAVAVSSGPGSYTALRAGYSSAKGICLALDIPLITVSTLRALANTAVLTMGNWEGEIVSILPARRKEVYFGRYDAQLNTLIEPICAEADQHWWNAQLNTSHIFVAGPTAKQISQEAAQDVRAVDVAVKASNLLPLAAMKYSQQDFVDTAQVEPNYVKPPFITKAKPRFLS